MLAPPPAPAGIPLVYIVDDEASMRESLAWLLRSRRLLSESFASAEAFEAALDAGGHASLAQFPTGPSCLLLDLRLDGMTGTMLHERLLARGLTAALPIIFLTGHGDVPTAVDALQRGAFDFVEKSRVNNALVDRVERALQASTDALAQRHARALRAHALRLLTPREHQIMLAIADGQANREIADATHLSVRTVELHRAKVFDKLGVGSAVALANLLHAMSERH
jgi:two-component system response regulator DctR